MPSFTPLLSRPALIRVLTAIQNAPCNQGRDILTFTGFMDDAEVGAHVWICFKALPDAEKARALASLKSVAEAA